MLSPNFILRFILHCKSKEEAEGDSSGLDNGDGSEVTSLTF
jgi:hypothetical protein